MNTCHFKTFKACHLAYSNQNEKLAVILARTAISQQLKGTQCLLAIENKELQVFWAVTWKRRRKQGRESKKKEATGSKRFAGNWKSAQAERNTNYSVSSYQQELALFSRDFGALHPKSPTLRPAAGCSRAQKRGCPCPFPGPGPARAALTSERGRRGRAGRAVSGPQAAGL